MQTPTTDQLRQGIDSGLTGEKVSMPDPAAAPLATDAEAGGVPPTTKERTLAAEQVSEDAVPAPRGPPGIAVYASVIGIVAIVLVTLVILAAS
jgi:hypothetical protein